MSNPAFILTNGNLTYDPSEPYLCTDEDHICYGLKVPVPVPGGGGGGGGGGFISGAPLAPLFPCEMGTNIPWLKLKCRPELMGAFAKSIVKRIQGEIQKEVEKQSYADPLSIPKTISPEKVRERDLRRLRERIRRLEEEAVHSEATHAAEATELRQTVERLRQLLTELQAQVDRLRAERIIVGRRPVAIEQRAAEAVSAALDPSGLESAEEALAKMVLSATLAAATEPARIIGTRGSRNQARGVLKLLGAVGLALVVDRVDEPVWIRTAGFGAALAVGLSGVSDLIGVGKMEDAT